MLKFIEITGIIGIRNLFAKILFEQEVSQNERPVLQTSANEAPTFPYEEREKAESDMENDLRPGGLRSENWLSCCSLFVQDNYEADSRREKPVWSSEGDSLRLCKGSQEVYLQDSFQEEQGSLAEAYGGIRGVQVRSVSRSIC